MSGEWLATAKDIVRAHVRRTYGQARRAENKPICRCCFIPVDPRTREYRALRLCTICYATELAPLTTKPKELICPPKSSP